MQCQEWIVNVLGLLEIFGFGSFPMQKPSWDEVSGWLEEPFKENALTTDEMRFNRSYEFLCKFPEFPNEENKDLDN
jgi:hypothetical protein